jgi:hypothetical protein
MDVNPTLAEAKRIASQPTGDRLDGKQGQEARDVMLRLLEDSGLDYIEALRLVDTYGWERWTAGSRSARDAYRDTERI